MAFKHTEKRKVTHVPRKISKDACALRRAHNISNAHAEKRKVTRAHIRAGESVVVSKIVDRTKNLKKVKEL